MGPPRRRLRRACSNMFPLPPFLEPSAVYAGALNKLLRREDWARDRLARHAGKTVRFKVGGVTLGLALQSSGFVEAGNAAVAPDVTLTIPAGKLAQVPAVLGSGNPDGLAELMHVDGDAGLAHVVSGLARDLRWDIENDLSALVGDIAALRLLQAGRALAGGVQQASQRLAGNAAEYLTEESGMLASRPAFDDWSAGLRAALQRLDALDARMFALEAARKASKT